jgi:hypothetical protein
MAAITTITPEELARYQEEGGTPPSWTNLAPGNCEMCDDPNYPPRHIGSPYCQSHGLGAAGGFRAHCTCDLCY